MLTVNNVYKVWSDRVKGRTWLMATCAFFIGKRGLWDQGVWCGRRPSSVGVSQASLPVCSLPQTIVASSTVTVANSSVLQSASFRGRVVCWAAPLVCFRQHLDKISSPLLASGLRCLQASDSQRLSGFYLESVLGLVFRPHPRCPSSLGGESQAHGSPEAVPSAAPLGAVNSWWCWDVTQESDLWSKWVHSTLCFAFCGIFPRCKWNLHGMSRE